MTDSATKTKVDATIEPLVNEEGEPLSPLSNVLPRSATADEHDVHWFFNWAAGELAPSPTFSIFDQELLAARCSVGSYHERVEFTGRQLRAAKRARDVDAALSTLDREHVRTLQRWSLPPTVFADSVREVFGRLAGVAMRTASARALGDDHSLRAACARLLKKDAPDVVSIDRRRARLAIESMQVEARAALAAAFEAYARARRAAEADIQATNERKVMAATERALRGQKAE